MRWIVCSSKIRHVCLLLGFLLLAVAVGIGLWVGANGEKPKLVGHPRHALEGGGITRESRNPQSGDNLDILGSGGDNASSSDRLPRQFRSKPVKSTALLTILAPEKKPVDVRVKQLQGMRGIALSDEECDAALEFLAGNDVPEGMGKSSMQWLADELLTVMRLQDPPWEGLGEELAKVAFQSGTDPIVRDYIMQHLGHLWEQYGSRKEIDEALWRAVGDSDETTPGTALIALSRGYERDQQENDLAKVRQLALKLARNPDTSLAVRVTALSIAGDGGGNEVKKLAAELVQNTETPVILKKVAEQVIK